MKKKIEVLPTREQIAEYNDGVMFAEGFDDCLLGIVERFGSPALALYDYDRVIQKLMKRDGMSEEEASEFFEFNTQGAYCGKGTPGFATILKK